MKFEHHSIKFKALGKTYTGECTIWKPGKQTMFRAYFKNGEREVVIIFQEDKTSADGLKFYPYKDSRDEFEPAVRKALIALH